MCVIATLALALKEVPVPEISVQNLETIHACVHYRKRLRARRQDRCAAARQQDCRPQDAAIAWARLERLNLPPLVNTGKAVVTKDNLKLFADRTNILLARAKELNLRY